MKIDSPLLVAPGDGGDKGGRRNGGHLPRISHFTMDKACEYDKRREAREVHVGI